MAFDGIVTKAITAELTNLCGARIDKVFQPNKNEIILGLYLNKMNYALDICIDAQNCRINLTTNSKSNPQVAPNFCMLLRKNLIGLKLKNIITFDLERLVILEFEGFDELDDIISKKLVVELMGKHSNIILLDDTNIIIDSLRHIKEIDENYRDILPHTKYSIPTSNKCSFLDLKDFDDFKNHLNLSNIEDLPVEISNTFNGLSKNFICSIINKFEIKETSETFRNYRNTLFKLILDALKKYNKRLTNINKKLHECDDMEKYRVYGELITANLYKIPNKNIEEIELENYYDNNNKILIKLDKRYSPSINAKRFFKKYSKLKNALAIVTEQKKETLKELDYIESIVYELEDSTIKKSQWTKNKEVSFNPIKYNIDGYTILVGRNNNENDYLTLKYANKNDLWFHTKDFHGSHTVLKIDNNLPYPNFDILVATAQIAAQHSKAKNSSNVPVDYCEVKFVKKPSGARPGMVIYTNNKTLNVNPI